MGDRTYYVYILASAGRVLYVGFTGDLARRLLQHRIGTPGSFTWRYNVTRLVYYEARGGWRDAFTRERQIKGWRRERKIALVDALNPGWRDLARDVLG